MSYRKKDLVESICKCGCNGKFMAPSRKRPNGIMYKKYITGHRATNKRPSKKCLCNCKEQFIPTANRLEYIRGHDPMYRKHRNPKGWTITSSGRYKQIYMPNHPFATQRGYIREHRLIAEILLGRYLKPTEEIHHKNGNPLDNQIDNLIILTKAQHTSLHHKGLIKPKSLENLKLRHKNKFS